MVREDYVPVRLAERLMRRGFCEDTVAAYVGDTLLVKGDNTINNCTDVAIVLAPTYQEAMRWLRGKGIEIIINIGLEGAECKKTYYWTVVECRERRLEYPITYVDGSVDTPAETWESAVRDGIEYCLEKLI
mgnify:CR=1 FL=1